MRNALKYTLYVLLIFILVNVVVTELVARLLGQEPYKALSLNIKLKPENALYFVPDSLLGYKMAPGSFSMTYPNGFVFEPTNNNAGYRQGASYDSSATGDIWVFGCSYTYGWAVADDETYCSKLNEMTPGFNVINYGVSGYSTVQNLLDLKQKLATQKQPNVVVFTYAYFHDERNGVTPNWLWKNSTFSKEMGPIAIPAANMVDSNLVISYVPLVYHPWPLSDISAFSFWLERKNMESINEAYTETKTAEKLLLEAQRVCHKKGIGFVVTLIMDDDRTIAIRDFCLANNIIVKIIAPDWDLPGITNAPNDNHPSPAGHDSLAVSLYELLSNPVKY